MQLKYQHILFARNKKLKGSEMKNMIAILIAMAVILTGCLATHTFKELHSDKVFIDHNSTWSNKHVQPERHVWRTITVCVVNGTKHDTKATIICKSKDLGTLFGTSTRTVYSHSSKKFVIYGLPKYFDNDIRCRLEYTYLVRLGLE